MNKYRALEMAARRQERTKAQAYIVKIRNPTKRAYAEAILSASMRGEEWPGYPEGLSCMAAQGVRMQLAEILPCSFH